jgi:hypothetical protein
MFAGEHFFLRLIDMILGGQLQGATEQFASMQDNAFFGMLKDVAVRSGSGDATKFLGDEQRLLNEQFFQCGMNGDGEGFGS